ncbi:MAG: hypothetical protein HWE13_08370 [Gammaproteobacteria bacterium]|nr:hypothetical protein [Gammaproteobacteria bacterium]NVK88127.1 hypothetical protein [Gammaproteobacteria bacterium]
MKSFLLIVLALMAHSISAIAPFTSDGCSMFPDGTFKQGELWLECCRRHDLAYWQGGTYQQRIDADRALQSCVAAVGEPAVAELMLAGVRVGGSPYFPTLFRWGYGWPYGRGYQPLNEAEHALVKAALAAQGITI